MKKILTVLILITLSSVQANVIYNNDGSITVKKNGKSEKISMEGKTVYGTAIKEKRKLLRRKSFYVEIIYSARFSDMPLSHEGRGNAVKRFYKELVDQTNRWLYKNRVGKGKMTVVMSNCRYSKTGFCRRKNRNEIRLYLYFNGKKHNEIALNRREITDKTQYFNTAQKTVSKIFSK